MENLAERIRKYRRERKISQSELAGCLGVSEMTVRRWESNIRSPRMEEVNRISEVLDIPISELLGDANTSEQMTTKSPRDDSVLKTSPQDRNYIGMSYWGNVVDNANTVAHSGDKGEMRLIASLLERALASLNVQLAAVPA